MSFFEMELFWRLSESRDLLSRMQELLSSISSIPRVARKRASRRVVEAQRQQQPLEI
jgi:hypothetical protein